MGKIKVDFTGVESYVKCEEGQHVARIVDVEEKATQNGDPMLNVKFEVVKGNSTGAIVYEAFPIVEKALWKLKSLLEAIGMKADAKVTIDTSKMEGKTCIIAVAHEEYNGQTKARINEYKKLAASKAREDEDEDEDEDEADDEPVKPSKKPVKKPAKKQPEPEEDEDEEDEDEDDEEDEPTPKKPTKKPEKKPAKKPAKKPVDDDDDDDDDWDEE